MSRVSAHQDLVGGELGQARRVIGPVLGRRSGDAPIVVQVYALGCGVTLVGQRSDLLLGQCAFELEANGKIFVFDPSACGHAHGFVPAVQGDVVAVGLPVKAVDQKDLAEFGLCLAHSVSPLKTVILSMPQGMGKSLLAVELAERLGCRAIVDEWTSDTELVAGALHLTHDVLLQGGAA